MSTWRTAMEATCEHPAKYQTTYLRAWPLGARYCVACGLSLGSRRHRRIEKGKARLATRLEELRTSGGWAWP